jgi:hypothetical protein
MVTHFWPRQLFPPEQSLSLVQSTQRPDIVSQTCGGVQLREFTQLPGIPPAPPAALPPEPELPALPPLAPLPALPPLAAPPSSAPPELSPPPQPKQIQEAKPKTTIRRDIRPSEGWYVSHAVGSPASAKAAFHAK